MSHADDQDSTRRDFLYYATGGAGAVVTGAAVWPLIKQMNPSADVQAASTMRVDISGIETGTQVTILFQGKPVFIRRRTEEEIAEARAVPVGDLADPVARNENLGEVDPRLTSTARLTRRLVLPLPRLALRHCGPDPQRPRTPENLPTCHGREFVDETTHPARIRRETRCPEFLTTITNRSRQARKVAAPPPADRRR